MSLRLSAIAFLLGLTIALLGCGEVTTATIDAAAGIDAIPTCEPACDVNATCTGTTCTCGTGYTGDGVTCADVNECATANGGCDPNALCTNTAGARTCACLLGFVGDGLACQQSWRLVGTFPGVTIDPDNFGAMAIGAGNRVYFANETNTAANELFRYFDTTTSTLSPQLTLPPAMPPNTTDFCACGYTQVFISDGTSIFMLGNFGQRYSVTGNSWSAVSTYTGTAQRGESAGVYEPTTGKLLLAGGRGPLNNAGVFTVSTSVFGDEPGVMPFAVDSAKAWALPGSASVYVAGGYSSDNSRKHLVRHTVGATAWESLPDAPMDIGRPLGVGHFGTRLWVANDSMFMFFNPATNAWDRNIGAPPNLKAAAFAAGTAWALSQGLTGLQVYKLEAIE